MKKIFLILLVTGFYNVSWANPNYWSSGYAQGFSEYTLTNNDGNSIRISCNEEGSDYIDHGVAVILKGDNEPLISDDGDEAPIEILVNNKMYSAPGETMSRLGSEEWYQFTSAITKAKKFTVFWNGENFGTFLAKNPEEISDLTTCVPMIDKNINDTFTQEIPPYQKSSYNQNNSGINPNKAFKMYYEVSNQGYGASISYLYLLSLENNISITGITANRGNCPLFRGEYGGVAPGSNLPNAFTNIYGSGSTFPVHLKYGQKTYFVFQNCPNILEVQVETNYGSAIYQF